MGKQDLSFLRCVGVNIRRQCRQCWPADITTSSLQPHFNLTFCRDAQSARDAVRKGSTVNNCSGRTIENNRKPENQSTELGKIGQTPGRITVNARAISPPPTALPAAYIYPSLPPSPSLLLSSSFITSGHDHKDFSSSFVFIHHTWRGQQKFVFLLFLLYLRSTLPCPPPTQPSTMSNINQLSKADMDNLNSEERLILAQVCTRTQRDVGGTSTPDIVSHPSWSP